MNEEINAISAVSRALDRVSRDGKFVDLTLSNGIVLSLKPVPPLLLQAINKEFVPPTPPKVMIEEKGREEENPNDPTYLKLLEKLAEEQDLAVNDMLLGVGTVVKFIPDGYYKPEDEGWVQQVKFASKLSGKEIEMDLSDPIRRYLFWLRFYAMETGADIILAQSLPMHLAGIREGEVDEVLESFRRLQEWRPDTDSPVVGGSSNGNSENRTARRSRSRT